jgi:hypothetical protein
MDSKQLEELLHKYWECETSLEEEQQLRDYFCKSNVPEQWKETAVLFHYFEAQKQKLVNTGFEEAVIHKIKNPKQGKVISLVQISLRIAAGVAVLLAAVFFVRQEIRKNNTDMAFEDTYDDPQKALEETKKALMMISKGFGKAEAQAKKINMLNEAQEKIQSKSDSTKEL